MGCVASSSGTPGRKRVLPADAVSYTNVLSEVVCEVDKLASELTSKSSEGVISDFYDVMPGSLGASHGPIQSGY